jgi:hypothetical protein
MDLNEADGPDEAATRIHRRLWRHWGTPASIYGTIVYASVVAAASGEDDGQASAIRLLVFSLVSIAVFWLAHVYSTALGFQGDAAHLRDRVSASVGHALRESGGMLEAAVVPSVPLLLAALGLIPVKFGVNLALWLAVIMLAVLGYSVFLVRGRPVVVRLIGAVITGAFGVVVILLKSALQH